MSTIGIIIMTAFATALLFGVFRLVTLIILDNRWIARYERDAEQQVIDALEEDKESEGES